MPPPILNVSLEKSIHSSEPWIWGWWIITAMVIWADALGNSAFVGQGSGRVGMGLIPQNNEFWALHCQTITQLWTGQCQALICWVTKLWAKLWTMREEHKPQFLPWLALPRLDAQLDVRSHSEPKELFKFIKYLTHWEMCLGRCEPPGLVLV